MSYLETAQDAFDAMTKTSAAVDKLKTKQVTAQDALLNAAKEAQQHGVNFHSFKITCYQANGWSYQDFDAATHTMFEVNGENDTPQVVSNNMSALKKGYNLNDSYDLLQFDSFKEMKEATKPVDEQANVKATFNTLNKALKKANKKVQINGEWVSWNDYAIGILEGLIIKVDKVSEIKDIAA